MAKGLESDAVIICGVDLRNYYESNDKKCAECTRALHKLRLFPPRGAYTADRRMLIEGAADPGF